MSTKVKLDYTSKYDRMQADSPTVAGGKDAKEKKKKEKPPVHYPSLVIIDKPELLKLLEVGKDVKATVTLHVDGLKARDPKSTDRWEEDHKIEFTVRDIELEGEKEEEDLGSKEKPADFSALDAKTDDAD